MVHDYQAMDRLLREEKKYIAGICKKIRASGANVVLVQKVQKHLVCISAMNSFK